MSLGGVVGQEGVVVWDCGSLVRVCSGALAICSRVAETAAPCHARH